MSVHAVQRSSSTFSYFSEIHSNIHRALLYPLAPGWIGCSKDLLGRVVILTFALPGYVVAALLSIPFFLKKKEAAALLPSECIHDQDHPALPLSDETRASLRMLCDPNLLEEIDILYHGNLDSEKKEIDQKMRDPNMQELIAYIKEMGLEDQANRLRDKKRPLALAVLFVVLGIKPVHVFEYAAHSSSNRINAGFPLFPRNLIPILKKLSGEHLRITEKTDIYIVNERPLESFDPRRFLTHIPGNSLTEAVVYCFPRQNQMQTDQGLSYLLGFGPSWEAYVNNHSSFRMNQSARCLLSEDHYYEIGQVLYQHLFKKMGTRAEVVALGRAYHVQAGRLFTNPWRKSRANRTVEAIERFMQETGIGFFYDRLTARTEYFRRSLALKKWVLETYFPESSKKS